MIGKAKKFIYALYSPNKRVSPVNFRLKWYHRCLLVFVRRCKTLKDCPDRISYFEWDEAKKKGISLLQPIRYGIHFCIGYCIFTYLKKKDDETTERDFEERLAKGLPLVPQYQVFKSDQFYDTYNTEFPSDYKY